MSGHREPQNYDGCIDKHKQASKLGFFFKGIKDLRISNWAKRVPKFFLRRFFGKV